MQFDTGPYTVQTLNWENLGALPVDQSSSKNDSDNGSGSYALISASTAAEALGIQSDQIAKIINTFPANLPIVFGRYTPGKNVLRIDVFTTRKADGKTMALHAQFGPAQGSRWAAARTYQDPTIKSSIYEPGPNPFARFDQGDGLFHNITQSAAYAAMGHAMRLVGSSIGLLAVAKYRLEKHVDSSGGLFVKKTTLKINGYTKPQWFIAGPKSLIPNGITGAVCAVDTMPCPVYAIAPALVNFQHWQGGDMLDNEDLLYHHEESHSGLTVFTMMLIIFVVNWAASAYLTAMAGETAAGGAAAGGTAAQTATQVATTTGASGGAVTTGALSKAVTTLLTDLGSNVTLSPLAVGSLEAISYGVTNLAGGGDLFDVQNGLYGKVETGYAAPLNSDQLDQYSEGLINATVPKMTGTVTNSLSANEGVLYGNCSPGVALANCGNGNTGVISRDDTYIEHNSVQWVRDNGMPLVSGVTNGALQ
jgi:hypothetical protein